MKANKANLRRRKYSSQTSWWPEEDFKDRKASTFW